VIAVPALCPLRQFQECLHEKCAWYDPVAEECSIKLIAEVLRER
jgi:hypothetical protein